MVEVYAEGVGKNSTAKFEKYIQLPTTLQKSNKKMCKVLEVSYELVVYATTEGWHTDFDVVIPITISSAVFGEPLPAGNGNREMSAPYPKSDVSHNVTASYAYPGSSNAASSSQITAPVAIGWEVSDGFDMRKP